MDENEIYEALGLTPPVVGQSPMTSPGADTPDDASGGEPPAGTGGQDPEAVSELDTDAAGNVSELDTDATEKDGSGRDGGAAPGEAGEEKGSAQAAQEARWRALAQQEVQRAVEAEQARNQAEWHAFFASAGLKNSLDGDKPITSLEEFRAWKTAYDRARLEQDLREGKLTPEALAFSIREAMSGKPQQDPWGPSLDPRSNWDGLAHPQGSESRASNDRPGGASAAQGPSFSDALRTTGPADRWSARQPAAVQVTREQINAELQEIHRMDGSVNGLEDILKLETGGAFQEAVRRGHSFLDAFKLANFDRLQSQRQTEAAQRAAQAARNSARSKEHLRASGGASGESSIPVPEDVMEMYRCMMPKATEAEISAHYNRALKEMKK